MAINKNIFILFIMTLVFLAIFLVWNIKNPDQKVVANFLKISTLSGFSFYLDSFYLRHRDLNNIDTVFDFSPSLKERSIGTFILKAPIK